MVTVLEESFDHLEEWGFAVFPNRLSEDECSSLTEMGRESDERVSTPEREEASGVTAWNYLPDELEISELLLPDKLLSGFSSIYDPQLYLRRRPFYKENQPGDHEDISYI